MKNRCRMFAAAVAATLLSLTVAVPAQEALTVKPYGFLKADAIWDSSRTFPGDISFYVRPKVGGRSDDELSLHARDTRIGVDVAAPEANGVKAAARIESDFLGGGAPNAYTPRIRLAWLDLDFRNGWAVRAGQDWDAFVVQMVKTPDFGLLGNSGALWQRRPQARLTYTAKPDEQTTLTARLAAARTIGEGPTNDLDGGGQDDGADAAIPTLQGALILDRPLWTEKAARLAVSGHWGRETLDTAAEGRITAIDTADYDTWSVIGTFVIPVAGALSVQGSVWQGRNLDSFLGGVGQGINTTLGREIAAKGGWAQALLDVTANLSLSAGYGLDDPDDADLNAGQRAKNSRIFANVYYKLTPQVTLATEVAQLRTEYKGADAAEATRVQASAIFNF